MYLNSNIWDVFWMKKVQMGQNVVGRWQMAGAIRSLVNARDLLGACIKYCLCLFLHIAVRQYYERRRRDLGLGLYIWTNSEAYTVLGGWIESWMHG